MILQIKKTSRFIILLFILNSAFAQPEPSEKYANNVVLQADNYNLYWNYNDTDITFEIHVRTKGWAGFGLSPNGGMNGSDVIVVWIDKSGKVNFTDRHINNNGVVIDKKQNWMPLLVVSKGDFLQAKFTRKIKLCDESGEDRDVEPGTPFVIFSYGKNFLNGDITYHDSRGSKTLPLINSLNQVVNIDMSKVETVDYRVNASLDSQYETIYYCAILKLPADWFKTKRHLIRYETLYTPETKDNFHHWTMGECNEDFENVYLKNNPYPDPGYCVVENHQITKWANPLSYCGKSSLVWAVGSSDIQDFPEDIAYPMGGEKNFKYFLFEIHYNNPNKIQNLIDRSGIRFYATTEYRKTEMGILSLGTGEDWKGLIIPPRLDRFEASFGCNNDCLDNFFQESQEIKFFSAMPHTHLLGKEVYLTVVRDGKEVAYIINNRYYDFNYQYYNFLDKPFSLKPGDKLKLTCVYNTMNKDEFTYTGFSTEKEMCNAFVMYYPKTSVSGCAEVFDKDTVVPFLQKLSEEGITMPVNTSDPEVIEITLLNKNVRLGQKFEEFYAKLNRTQLCAKGDSYKDALISVNEAPKSEPMNKPVCHN